MSLVYRPVARKCPADTEASPSTAAESRTQEIQAILGLHQASRYRIFQAFRWTCCTVE